MEREESPQLLSGRVHVAPHSRRNHVDKDDIQSRSCKHFSSSPVLDCERVDGEHSRRFVVSVLPSFISDRMGSTNNNKHMVQRSLLEPLDVKVGTGEESQYPLTASNMFGVGLSGEVINDSTSLHELRVEDSTTFLSILHEPVRRLAFRPKCGAHYKTNDVHTAPSRSELPALSSAHSHVPLSVLTQTKSSDSSVQIPQCASVAAASRGLYRITNAPSFALVPRDEVSSLYTATVLHSPRSSLSFSSVSCDVEFLSVGMGDDFCFNYGAFGPSCDSSVCMDATFDGK